MPYFNVPVTAICKVLVEAANEAEAMERATDEITYGIFKMTSAGPAQRINSEDVDSFLRHADVVLTD